MPICTTVIRHACHTMTEGMSLSSAAAPDALLVAPQQCTTFVVCSTLAGALGCIPIQSTCCARSSSSAASPSVWCRLLCTAAKYVAAY
jgi:hypothetical protein